jgi:hypothetical protein
VGAEPSRGDTCEEETKEGARGEEGAHEEEFEEGLWGRGGVAPSSYCVMGHTIGGPFFYPFEACGLRELSSKNHPSPQRA